MRALPNGRRGWRSVHRNLHAIAVSAMYHWCRTPMVSSDQKLILNLNSDSHHASTSLNPRCITHSDVCCIRPRRPWPSDASARTDPLCCQPVSRSPNRTDSGRCDWSRSTDPPQYTRLARVGISQTTRTRFINQTNRKCDTDQAGIAGGNRCARISLSSACGLLI